MAQNNDWFGKLKSRARSVQETAKTRLEKLSETVDKKLKEAQDDLERQRAKVEAPNPIAPHLQRWRPSAENPDGELVPEVKPTLETKPIAVVQSLPPEPSPLENSLPLPPVEETIETIRHKPRKRPAKRHSVASVSSASADQETDSVQDQRTLSFLQSDNHEEIRHNSNDTNQQINGRRIEAHSSNASINKIPPVDESIENVTVDTIPSNEELKPVQNSTSYVENSVDKEIEKSTSSSTKLDQENFQTNIPSINSSTVEQSGTETILIETPNIDDSSTLMSTDSIPNAHSVPENTQMKIPDDQSPTITSYSENIWLNTTLEEISPPPPTDIDKFSMEHSMPEDIPINKSVNEVLSATNTVDSTTINSGLEDVSIKVRQDELTTLSDNEDLRTGDSNPENIPTEILDEKPTTLTTVEEISTVHSDSENVPTDIVDDEKSTSSNIRKSSFEYPEEDNSLIKAPVDQIPTTTTVDDTPTDDSDLEKIPIETPVNQAPATAITDNIPAVDFDLEETPIKAPADKVPTTTNIDDTQSVDSDAEEIPIKTLVDQTPVTTIIDDALTADSDQEDSPIKTPVDQIPATTTTGDTQAVDSDLEDSSIKALATTITDNVPSVDSDLEETPIKIPVDQVPATTITENLPAVDSDVEEIPIQTPTHQAPVTTNIDDTQSVDSDAEEIPIQKPVDQAPATTNIEDTQSVDSDLENIPIERPGDHTPFVDSDSENVTSNVLGDKPSILTNIDNSPSVRSTPGEIISDDEYLPIVYTGTGKTSVNIPADELPITTNTAINKPNDDNDKPSTLEDRDDSSTDDFVSKNRPVKISNDELVKSAKIEETPTTDSSPANIPIVTPTLTKNTDTLFEETDSEDEFQIFSNVNKSQIRHSNSNSNENHSVTSENTTQTPSDELEDSFDKLKTPNTSTNRAPEERRGSSTNLAALRDFISTIEDESDNDDKEFIPTKQVNKILEKSIDSKSEQLTKSNIFENTSISPSDETALEMTFKLFTSNEPLSDQPTNDEINESATTMSLDTKSVENQRFPVINYQTIPAGAKINHITCSLTYIYICTTDRKIFYAKLNSYDIEYSLKWQSYSELAERLAVSHSNKTIWRLLNKHVYVSKDPTKFPPLGSQWNIININNGQSLLSMSINDQCGWFIREDGSLWLIRADGGKSEPLNVTCPFELSTVFCFTEKIGVTTKEGEVLIRVGCTNDCLEGDGWIFVEHNFGPIDDFVLLTNNNVITILDKNHQLWIQQWPSEKGFYEIICRDDFYIPHDRYLISVNSELLCYTDCEEQIQIFSDALTGFQWNTIESNTRFQRLIGAFSNEDFVWVLTTDKIISASNGQILEKPRQAQYLTHATFVPNNTPQDTVLWSLDESCTIYVRDNVESTTQWEQADRTQFEWSRRLVNIVCNHAGVWAVDDHGCIHFRHGHISASQHVQTNTRPLLPPAWITVPGEPKRHRCFAQVFCGPVDWMVYATDNKQNVYTREGINKENRIGTSWKVIEDCSALELAISSQTLWLLTSHGQIQCRENISMTHPIGTRSTTLPGLFLSLTVSMDDSQVWVLDSKRNLLKLDRLTVLFEK